MLAGTWEKLGIDIFMCGVIGGNPPAGIVGKYYWAYFSSLADLEGDAYTNGFCIIPAPGA